MSQLYTREVTSSGRTTYKPVTTEPPTDYHVESEQVTTLLSTLVISMLMSIETQLPPHAKIAREVKLLEAAVLRFAQLNKTKLDDPLIAVGIETWAAALMAMQTGLQRIGVAQ